jgi:hypothetical protein
MLQIIDGEIEPTRSSVCYLCYDMVGHCEAERGAKKRVVAHQASVFERKGYELVKEDLSFVISKSVSFSRLLRDMTFTKVITSSAPHTVWTLSDFQRSSVIAFGISSKRAGDGTGINIGLWRDLREGWSSESRVLLESHYS